MTAAGSPVAVGMLIEMFHGVQADSIDCVKKFSAALLNVANKKNELDSKWPNKKGIAGIIIGCSRGK